MEGFVGFHQLLAFFEDEKVVCLLYALEAFELAVYLVDDLHELHILVSEHLPYPALFLDKAASIASNYNLSKPVPKLTHRPNNNHPCKNLLKLKQIPQLIKVLY